MTDEEKKLFKTYYDHNQQLITENLELRRKGDPTPADAEYWRRTTYEKLEASARQNVEVELEEWQERWRRATNEVIRLNALLEEASWYQILWAKIWKVVKGYKPRG